LSASLDAATYDTLVLIRVPPADVVRQLDEFTRHRLKSADGGYNRQVDVMLTLHVRAEWDRASITL
jgi:hypothetical protein